ncbi:MAG: hypothetical protein E7637_05750 [Ruminococcaceae bacterium]|nr:hypothetical protein [Oscillospiraceae bacterium]
MEKVLDVIRDIWAISLVKFIVYLLVAFIAAAIAKFLVVKLLKLIKLDKKLDKWGVNEGQVGTSMSFVGKLVYLIVFLLFLPSALAALGITSAYEPINHFVSTFTKYLPKIIAAGILAYVGFYVAIILGQVVSVLLKKTKLDNLVKKNENDEPTVLLSDILVKILMAVIILITLVQAFIVLGINAISAPALQIVEAIFGAIPSIILAVVVISCGLLITNIVCNLLFNVLIGIGFDATVNKLLPQMKMSATKILVNIVRTLIVLFVVAQGVEVLGLTILTMIVTEVVAYLPLVIKAAVIAAVAFIGAGLLDGYLSKKAAGANALGKIAKVAIFTVAGFMILSQLELAAYIVNTAFVVTLAAIAIAFALAFGLGGKDFAKKTLDKMDEKIEQSKSDDENK